MRVVHPVRRALHGSHIKLIQYVRRYEPAGRYQAELTETLVKTGFGTIGFVIAATAVAQIRAVAMLVRLLGLRHRGSRRRRLVMSGVRLCMHRLWVAGVQDTRRRHR